MVYLRKNGRAPGNMKNSLQGGDFSEIVHSAHVPDSSDRC